MYCIGRASEKFLLGEMKKVKPLLGCGEMMPNTKETEKDCRVLLLENLWKRNGAGWIAWPLSLAEPLVRSSTPCAVTMAAPSRTRLVSAKPE